MKRATLVILILALALAILPYPSYADENVTVRVRLSSGGASSAEMTVVGTYEVDGTKFTGGSITVAASGGTVTLRHSDKGELGSGDAVRVKRQAADNGSAYLIYDNAVHNSCCYLGDMVFTADGDTLLITNYVGMHEYLYGAVCGEVSESSHEEVLKVQVIAAKCFALTDVQASTSKSFDLYDTSKSQNYVGYVAGDVRSIAAVDEVWENTLLYNGKVVRTYYCTANGGQVITPRIRWGGTDNDGAYSYRYDPYDLAGSSKSVQLVISGTSPASMKESLYNYLLGLASDAVSGTATKILSVSAMNGFYDTNDRDGSARYPKDLAPQEVVEVVMTVARSGKSDTECTVEFSPKALVSEGIVSAEGNICFVTQTGNGQWTLAYGVSSGHRAGMSHRGAKKLATLGYSYVDILKFYFAGAELTRPDGTVIESDAEFGYDADPVLEVTAYGYVNADEVNLRSGASTDYGVIEVLNTGDVVELYGTSGSWTQVKVTASGNMGWVYSKYITVTGTPTPTVPTVTSAPTATPAPTVTPTVKPTVSPTICTAELKKGDVDGNGSINAADASKILRYLVGLDTISGTQYDAADTDGDGSVKAGDASAILRHLVGLDRLS